VVRRSRPAPRGKLEAMCDPMLATLLGEQGPADDVALLAVRRE
jgi:hypothetical protein